MKNTHKYYSYIIKIDNMYLESDISLCVNSIKTMR